MTFLIMYLSIGVIYTVYKTVKDKHARERTLLGKNHPELYTESLFEKMIMVIFWPFVILADIEI